MIDFNFVSPTKIYFGKNKELLVGKICKEFGYKKILIVCGEGSVKRSGLFDKVVASLKEENIEYLELSKVRPNPSLESSKNGVKMAKNARIDAILAIGGGSVIDVAKSISVSYFYDGDPFDFNAHKIEPKQALPIGVILTISASGSELSDSCVIANDELGVKQGFNSDVVRPKFAIINPELTFTVSKYQTGCGIVDIISHSLERYFSKSAELEPSDAFALAVIKETVDAGAIAIKEPENYDARASLMLLGSYSHNGLTSLGKKKDMPIHKMEHALSAYDIKIAHGAGLSILIPAWMEYVYKEDEKKFKKFAEFIFGTNSAEKGIQSLRDYFKSIGMPVTLKEVGLLKEDIPALVDNMTDKGTRMVGLNSIKPLNEKDLTKILESVL